MQVPGYFLGRPEGVAWLDRLPRVVGECGEQWSLELGPISADANVA